MKETRNGQNTEFRVTPDRPVDDHEVKHEYRCQQYRCPDIYPARDDQEPVQVASDFGLGGNYEGEVTGGHMGIHRDNAPYDPVFSWW